jgi:hypothetical protein
MEARQLAGDFSPSEGALLKGNLLGNPIERRRWFRQVVYEKSPLFVRAFVYFFFRYLLRGGILDGTPGLIYHVLHGFWFRFYIDACLYERRLASRGTSVGRKSAWGSTKESVRE